MSEDTRSHTTRIALPWFTAFIVLKFVSTYAATWSWWWLLLPVVPVIATIAHRLAL